MLWIPLLLLVMVWIWPVIWFRMVKQKLELRIEIANEQVTCGDWFELRVRIRNQAWLPCPFVEFSSQLPAGLAVQPDWPLERNMLRFRTFLFLRQETTFSVTCYASMRGPYKIHEAALKVNEGFGIRTVHLYIPIDVRLYVSPRAIGDKHLQLQLEEIVGQIEVNRWLYPDEALLRGLREYQRGDSFKHIAWLASARSGTWMTKQFSSSTDAKVFLMLNAQVSEQYWERVSEEVFGPLCSITAGVGYKLAKMGLAINFVTNAVVETYPKTQWFGLQKAEGIHTLLGKAHTLAQLPLERLMPRLQQVGTERDVVFLITHSLTQEHASWVQRLAARGISFIIISGTQNSSSFRFANHITMIYDPSIGGKSELNSYVS